MTCEACSTEVSVFDGLQHGYDGELGHTDHLKGEISREVLHWNDDTLKRHDRIFAQFTYNIEQSERDEISKEENIAAVDLFDWFSLIEDDPETGEVMWDYECA